MRPELLESLMYIPVSREIDGEKRLYIIYSLTRTQDLGLSLISFDPACYEQTTINVLDVTKTVDSGISFFDTWITQEEDELAKSLEPVEVDNKTAEILTTMSIMTEESNKLALSITQISSSLACLNKAIDPQIARSDTIVIRGYNEELVSITISSTDDRKVRLSDEEIQTLAQSVNVVLETNKMTDIQEPEVLEQIIQDLEFKILESLPVKTKAEAIHIVKENILNEMEVLKQETDNEDTI